MKPAILLLGTLHLLAQPAPVPKPSGSLTVTPTRLVLEGRMRSGEVVLLNGGSEPCLYRVSMVHMQMGEDGRLVEAPKPTGATTAEDLIRFAPRQVLLAPGQSQMVRIQVRKPDHLEPGEYRSHMVFRAVPSTEPTAEPTAESAPGLSLNIQAIYGVSIPIIVRHGATAARGSLTELQLIAPTPAAPVYQLAFKLNKQGNQSIFGDLVAHWQPKGGKPRPVARLNGVALYSGNAFRTVRLKLPGLDAGALGPGLVKVALLEHGTSKVLAEASLERR